MNLMSFAVLAPLPGISNGSTRSGFSSPSPLPLSRSGAGSSPLLGLSETATSCGKSPLSRISPFSQLLNHLSDPAGEPEILPKNGSLATIRSFDDLSLEQAALLASSLQGLASNPDGLMTRIKAMPGLPTIHDMDGADSVPPAAEAQNVADQVSDALLALLGAMSASQTDLLTRITAHTPVQMQPAANATALSAATDSKAFLQDILRRLTGLLSQLADLAENVAKQSASQSKNSQSRPADFQPQSAFGQDILVRLSQALSPNAPQASSGSGKAQTSALPDLIYFASPNAQATRVASLDSANLRAVSLRPLAGSDPVEGLQKLVEKLRNSVRDIERGDNGPALDPSYQHFLLARLGMPHTSATGPSAPASPLADPSALTDRAASIQQVQAAIADMVDRLQGDATLDSKNMRAVIHLDPPAIGRLHVDLRIDDTQRVSAHIAADNAATHDFLKQHQQEFHQGLNRQGFRDDQIDLRFSDEEGNGFDPWIAGPVRLA